MTGEFECNQTGGDYEGLIKEIDQVLSEYGVCAGCKADALSRCMVAQFAIVKETMGIEALRSCYGAVSANVGANVFDVMAGKS